MPNMPLIPKKPEGPLRVLILGRISTPHQHLESIDASYRYVEEYLGRNYTGPLHLKHLGERASGLLTDRVTIVEAEEEIATGTWDLVIMEELSRAYRNPRHQYAFVQDAVDSGTRVICIGDNLDTADENWEINMGSATLRHGLSIPETRRRVRRTARNTFHSGGMVQKYRFGYRKLSKQEADSGEFGPKGLRIAIVPECTPIIKEIARRVLNGANYTTVADWLDQEGVAPGPYVKKKQWTARLVEDLLRDPILHGTRTFADVLSQSIFRNGKRKRRPNPNGPQTQHYAELAHLSEQEHAELLRVMDARAQQHRRSQGADHPLFAKPRSRSIWPAQHPRCAICGESMYRYNNDALKCSRVLRGSGESPCWNHVQVDCQEVRERVLPWVITQFERVAGFRDALIDSAWQELQKSHHRGARNQQSLNEEIAELERRSANLAIAIGKGGQLEALVQQLTEVDRNLKDAQRRLAERTHASVHVVPTGSRADVERHLPAVLQQLAKNSYEFADLMRRIIPEFWIVPVQALDTGLVRPQARLMVSPAALLDGPCPAGSSGARPGEIVGVLDLFEPPVHIRAIPACVAAKTADPKATLDKIAARTGYNRMAVKRALAYAKKMEAEGMTHPYRELTSCPDVASRWRHRDTANVRIADVS